MKFAPDADPEYIKSVLAIEESFNKKMSQLNILKETMGLPEAYKAVFGKELEIDETDDNV